MEATNGIKVDILDADYQKEQVHPRCRRDHAEMPDLREISA